MRVTVERQFPALLAAGIAFVVALMSALAVIRWTSWTYGTDTGTFSQIALNAFHGFTDGPEGGTHFAFHWSPILALLYPLVATTRSPLAVQFVQIVLISLTAVPVYAIVRAYAGETWATRCALLALIYPPLLSIAFEEFHELAFYPVLALGLVWAADRARWIWFAVLAVLIVLVREDACVDLIVVGLALGAVGLFSRQSRERGLLAGEPAEPERLTVAGAGLALLSAAMLAAYAWIVIPHAGHWAPHHFYDYPFARGPGQTALAIFTHPFALAAAILTLGRFTYLLEAFAPLAFLPLFTRWTLLALPGLAGVLLASDPMVWRMGFHYSLLWTPWLLLAASWVICKLVMARREDTALRWWIAAVALCVLVLAAFNPMHPAHYLRAAAFQQSANVAKAMACVPRTAPLMTHDEWFSHIALAYPRSTNLDEHAGRFDGFIVYTGAWKNAHLQSAVLPALAAAQERGTFRVVCAFGNVTVLEATSFRTSERRAGAEPARARIP